MGSVLGAHTRGADQETSFLFRSALAVKERGAQHPPAAGRRKGDP